MNEPELSRLLERGPTADDAVLHEIVRRRDHRRTRRVRELGIGAAVVALALVGSSIALGRHSPPQRVAIDNAKAANGIALSWRALSTAGPAASAAPSSAFAALPARRVPATCSTPASQPGTACAEQVPPTPLIERQVDGIAVTASLASTGTVAVPAPRQPDVLPASTSIAPAGFSCTIDATLEVTVKVGAAADATTRYLAVDAPRVGDATIEAVTTALVTAANRHAAVVVVRTSAPSDKVVAHFADGTSDAMRAIDGWAVLVDGGPVHAVVGTFGSVAVETAAGAEITRATLDRLPGIAYPGRCLRPLPVPENHTPSVTPG